MNRAILLTPPGAAAIAVVRLVGDKTGRFLQRHFSRPVQIGKAIHGTLSDGDRVIDDPVVVLHERGADVNIHGGPWIVRSLLELAEREGFEVIQTGEGPLPDEAVDGEIELERKILRHLPLARTKLALRYLLSQRSTQWDQTLHWLLYPPKIAIVGPPNAGKSTIANQLFGQERSITADVPGTTRDWVGELADVDGLAVFLIDTPGLRETTDAIERTAIEQSWEQIGAADLVVVILDGTDSVVTQRSWVERHPKALVVRNKCDLAGANIELDKCLPHLYTVATKGEGIDSVRQAIRRGFVFPAWRMAFNHGD
jgi:small GTP-binding protein